MIYRMHSAYRFTLEDSIYVQQVSHGKGIGKAVLGELIARCTALNYRLVIAVIGDSGAAGSIAGHQSFGFESAENFRSVIIFCFCKTVISSNFIQ